MQSSLGGVLRALVMLVCLIVAPLVALPDVSFPVWLKQLTKGRWSGKFWGEARASGDSQTAQARPAQPSPSSQRSGKGTGSMFGALPAALGQAEAGWPTSPTPPGKPSQPMLANAGVIAANLPASMGSEDKQPSGSADRAVLLNTVGTGARDPNGPRSAGEGLSRAQGIIPTAFVEQTVSSRLPLVAGSERANGSPFAQPTISTISETSAQPSARPTAEQLSRFRVVEERLRTLGAVHYLLETWGNATEYYRFRCRMPVAGSTTAVRHFEATDSDGLTAMSKVLKEIEAWKAVSL